jgi:ferric-dicitrate binding protein FerR (iron transport regulator)
MDRDRARELFSRYRDDDLSAEERASLEAFLEADPDSRREWEEFQRTLDEVSGLHLLQPPPGFAEAVEQKIRKRSRGRFFSEQRPTATWFAVVSFVLILFFVLAYLVLSETVRIERVEEEPAPLEPAAEPSVPAP